MKTFLSSTVCRHLYDKSIYIPNMIKALLAKSYYDGYYVGKNGKICFTSPFFLG